MQEKGVVIIRVVIHKLSKYTGYALHFTLGSVPVKPLLDIHDIRLHTFFTWDDIMNPVQYLLGKGYLNRFASFGLNRAYMKIQKPN